MKKRNSMEIAKAPIRKMKTLNECAKVVFETLENIFQYSDIRVITEIYIDQNSISYMHSHKNARDSNVICQKMRFFY